MFNKEFVTVTRDAVPGYVTANAPIVAKCTSSNGSPGSYRWTMTPRTLSFTMLSGTTANTTISGIGRRVNAAAAMFEVSEGLTSSTAQTQITVNTTGQLWNLSTSLSAGTYRLSHLFDISEEYCRWTGNHLTCKAQGPVRQYRANYTLTIVDSPPPGPARPTPLPGNGAGTMPSPGLGIKPNPWTVRGYAAKHLCETCDRLRRGD